MSDTIAVAVADTSVVINLNATERGPDILRNLPFRLVVTVTVAEELSEDRRSGRKDAAMLAELVQAGVLAIVPLGVTGMDIFSELVVGPTAETLDDGEASTIAYAVEHGIVPVIDERKALKIWRLRVPAPPPRSTVDLLAEASVLQGLGRAQLSDAVFRALQNVRMRVASQHVAWVVDLIGTDRAVLCPSLPKAARRR